MTRENAKDYLPLVQALAEGKTIQYSHGTQWLESEPIFNLPADRYRIKPEPKRVPLTAEDVPPGSTIRLPGAKVWGQVTMTTSTHVFFGTSSLSTYAGLHENYEIKRPGGEWEPCWKEEVV